MGALAPPAVFAGVSVATFLAPLAAAGARAALGGALPFVYDRGKDSRQEIERRGQRRILTSVVGFLVAAVGFLGVFSAVAISESESEGGRKKAMYYSQTLCYLGRRFK